MELIFFYNKTDSKKFCEEHMQSSHSMLIFNSGI